MQNHLRSPVAAAAAAGEHELMGVVDGLGANYLIKLDRFLLQMNVI